MSLNWKVGDKLLCVDSKGLGDNSGLNLRIRAGEEYTIYSLCNCSGVSVDVGTRIPGFITYICPYCDRQYPTAHYYPWRFVKLDPDFKLEEEPNAEVERAINKALRHALNYGVGPEIFNKLREKP